MKPQNGPVPFILQPSSFILTRSRHLRNRPGITGGWWLGGATVAGLLAQLFAELLEVSGGLFEAEMLFHPDPQRLAQLQPGLPFADQLADPFKVEPGIARSDCGLGTDERRGLRVVESTLR